jgi:hypothetical protein
MELQDDNPEHFEFALRFMYTPEYDHATAEKLAPATDEIKCAAFALGIHTIADKYDINRLISPAVADLRQILLKTTSNQALKSVIKKTLRLLHSDRDANGQTDCLHGFEEAPRFPSERNVH